MIDVKTFLQEQAAALAARTKHLEGSLQRAIDGSRFEAGLEPGGDEVTAKQHELEKHKEQMASFEKAIKILEEADQNEAKNSSN